MIVSIYSCFSVVSYVWLLLQTLATSVLVALAIVAVVTVIVTIWQSQWRRRLKRFYDRKR
jgi:Flp pilus assembly protein TadB